VRDLTAREQQVLRLLGDAFNVYSELPHVHPNDGREFVHAIHAAQNIVLARPATEQQHGKGINGVGIPPRTMSPLP
jgi:hypothetical protein